MRNDLEPTEPMTPERPAEQIAPDQPVQSAQPVQSERMVRARPTAAGDPRVPPWYTTGRVVYLILGIIESLLLIRLILKLLAANPAAGFSSLIYGITAPLVAPFVGVFPNAQGDASVLDVATILAMIVYALVAWGIVRLVEIATRHQRPTTY